MERPSQILWTDFHSDEDRYAERLRFSGCCSSSWKNCSAQLYTQLHNLYLILSPTNQTMKCEKALKNISSSQISFLCNNRMLWKRVTITAYDWNIGTLTQQTQAVTPLADQRTLCEDGIFQRDMVWQCLKGRRLTGRPRILKMSRDRPLPSPTPPPAPAFERMATELERNWWTKFTEKTSGYTSVVVKIKQAHTWAG